MKEGLQKLSCKVTDRKVLGHRGYKVSLPQFLSTTALAQKQPNVIQNRWEWLCFQKAVFMDIEI
jgi:hypothetical protein